MKNVKEFYSVKFYADGAFYLEKTCIDAFEAGKFLFDTFMDKKSKDKKLSISISTYEVDEGENENE